jgi:predicted lysophospholipase L1 biosynthesis ABC-type transport system permease subunit
VSLAFSLRMAWRETRGAWRHFSVFFGCVALGVAALVSVGTLAANLDRTLAREARTLTGGDLELRSARPLDHSERGALAELEASIRSTDALRRRRRRRSVLCWPTMVASAARWSRRGFSSV